jgi:outer membrane phospholipase A
MSLQRAVTALLNITRHLPSVIGRRKYFAGYGESPIDYNRRTQTIGLGFTPSDGSNLSPETLY